MKSTRKAIVMVDDEKPYVDLLADMLTAHFGWPVITFNHPSAALEALPALNPAVVVTDYHMPDLTGFEFAQKAGRLLPGVPFIMITGHPVSLEERRGPDSPLRALLHKPFGWRRLAEEIARQAPEFATDLAARAAATPTS